MPDIRAVIFDLGRVLIGLDLSRGLFAQLTDAHTEEADAAIERLLSDEAYVRFLSGKIDPQGFHRLFCERTGLQMAYDRFVDQWCEIFVPMPGMEQLLAEVAASLPVGLLSDTDPLHWRHVLRCNPWLNGIEKPTLSFATGLLKPDPGCYRTAADNVGQPPAGCLFIDDLERNVLGARAAGMQALRFEGAEKLRRQLEAQGVLRHVDDR